MKRTIENIEIEDIFMKQFKYYKSKNPKPSLEKVVTTQNDNLVEVTCLNNKNFEDNNRAHMLGLTSLSNWKIYSLKKHPGLILIKNPFTSMGQRYWIQQSLKVYPRKPNKTNIDVEKYIADWWFECRHIDDGNKLQKKLRWTTLGYHHNWDTKIYTEDNKTAFPEDLAELCDIFARYLEFNTFTAQAAIVNYYHMGSTLSAHTDHSEVNLEAPLFSFSFGQSAIFLLGGYDKSSEPTAILLESGDVVVMSKEARLCYHAVPKILPSLGKPWDIVENIDTIDKVKVNFKYMDKVPDMNELISITWSEFDRYIKESRININVRQVLKENQTRLHDNT